MIIASRISHFSEQMRLATIRAAERRSDAGRFAAERQDQRRDA